MLNKILKLNIPSDVFITLNESENELANNIKLFIAIKFYQLAKLTIGQAARLSGLTRYEFEKILAKNKIPISNLTIEDVEKDIKTLEKIL